MAQTTTFGDLEIAYDDQILAPRSWTTLQARWAADLLRALPEGAVLELCSGAGQIGLLAISLEPRRLVCVDDSEAACDFARRNARSAGLADLVDVRRGGLEEAVAPQERFVLVIADPPWVPSEEVGRHPEDPPAAIDGGQDGLDVARVCVRVATQHLAPEGAVLIQLGTPDQATALATETGLQLAELRSGEGGVVALLRPAAL